MPAKTTSAEVEVIDAFPQGSPEWCQARLGIPTASNFATIMAQGEGKTRSELMRKLAGERLTGEPAENYRSRAMERGNEMEAQARWHYEQTHFVKIRQIGFMRRKLTLGSYVGASPDSLVEDEKDGEGGLEIKTMAPHLLIQHVERGAGVPPEHRAQIHGVMWVGNLNFMDLKLFYKGMPVSPTYRVYRDETYIKQIKNEVERFDYELSKLVERMRQI